MNGKASKKLRKLANMKAQSWKEVTLQGVKAWKVDLASLTYDPRAINVDLERGVVYQHKLHPFSVGSIVKKLKGFFKATPRPERYKAFDAFKYMMDSHPELLGIPTQ